MSIFPIIKLTHQTKNIETFRSFSLNTYLYIMGQVTKNVSTLQKNKLEYNEKL